MLNAKSYSKKYNYVLKVCENLYISHHGQQAQRLSSGHHVDCISLFQPQRL